MPRGSVVTSGPSRLSDTAKNPAPRQAPPGELSERRLSSLGPVPSLVEDEIEKSMRWHDEAMAEPDCRYLLASDEFVCKCSRDSEQPCCFRNGHRQFVPEGHFPGTPLVGDDFEIRFARCGDRT
jgi:hypothetical protein